MSLLRRYTWVSPAVKALLVGQPTRLREAAEDPHGGGGDVVHPVHVLGCAVVELCKAYAATVSAAGADSAVNSAGGSGGGARGSLDSSSSELWRNFSSSALAPVGRCKLTRTLTRKLTCKLTRKLTRTLTRTLTRKLTRTLTLA